MIRNDHSNFNSKISLVEATITTLHKDLVQDKFVLENTCNDSSAKRFWQNGNSISAIPHCSVPLFNNITDACIRHKFNCQLVTCMSSNIFLQLVVQSILRTKHIWYSLARPKISSKYLFLVHRCFVDIWCFAVVSLALWCWYFVFVSLALCHHRCFAFLFNNLCKATL